MNVGQRRRGSFAPEQFAINSAKVINRVILLWYDLFFLV